MAGLLQSDLPSSDSEDDDFDPTGEKDEEAKKPKAGTKRRRGVPAAAAAGDEAEEADDDDPNPLEAVDTAAERRKKAKVGALWEQLQQKAGSGGGSKAKPVSLASLTREAPKSKKSNPDMLWMKSLGMAPLKKKAAAAAGAGGSATKAPSSSSSQPLAAPTGSSDKPQAAAAAPRSEADGKAAAAPSSSLGASKAAAAIAAAKELSTRGVASSYNKVTIKETRRFAGKDIEVALEVDKDSKAAQKAAEKNTSSKAAASGLDAFLQEVEKKKKVSILDKSKMDWKEYKTTDETVEEELETHKRSGNQFLDKQDFLKRAELREYEIERDKRLASDVRLRGRL